MANCLRLPITSPLCFSSSSSSVPSPKRRRFIATNSSKIPMPPLNPNDPFISRLASVAAESPEKLIKSSRNSDSPPFLDLYEPPELMARSMQAQRGAYGRPRRSPPDLPSIVLDGRVVYIGMPLVSAVSELIIAQLLWLANDSDKPIYLYINSTGTIRDDGEPIALDTEGFAIYDILTMMNIEIRTVNIGVAVGFACLFLALGAKGRRYSLPHAQAMIQQPRLPPTGLIQASDVELRAKQAILNRDRFVELFAKHTGNSEEVVAKAMRRTFHMDVRKAIQFGVVDKILWKNQTILGGEKLPFKKGSGAEKEGIWG